MLKASLIFLFLIGLFFFAVPVTAIPPPEVIAERNLEANFIVVGQVLGIHANDTPPHFVLKVVHVIKGLREINKGDQIKILLGPRPPETASIVAHKPGVLPVEIEEGRLALVYLDHFESHPGYLKPLLEGLSVITIGYPLPRSR